jgi:threonine aldolase
MSLTAPPPARPLTRSLTWHKPATAAEWFARLSAMPEASLPPDDYGQSAATTVLLETCRRELGKPAASFLAKGMIAQFAAVRAWLTRRKARQVWLHRHSHIVHDELGALRHFHPVELVPVGQPDQPVRAEDLPASAEGGGVLVLELPVRRAGFALPTWEELVRCVQHARRLGLAVHCDGARLFESAPALGRTPAQIAALFDSIYVSLYKGLGGLGGAVLLGSEDFVFDCEPWVVRHGGQICHSFPYILSGLWGLRVNAPKIPEWCARARRLGAAMGAIDGVRLHRAGVTCNAFQLIFTAPAEQLQRAHRIVETEFGFSLFRFILPHPQGSFAEIHLFDAADEIGDDEALAAMRLLVERAPLAT